ncbi:MAG: hypothetical protein QXQ69_02560 [Candidatus Aenigmatarchaeota archaeon]
MERKMLIFFFSLLITLLIFSGFKPIVNSSTQAQVHGTYNKNSWFIYQRQNETDLDKDGNPDITTIIIPINESVLEFDIKQTTKEETYEWSFVICNISGVYNIEILEYDVTTKVWNYGGTLKFEKLTDHELPLEWCKETDNYGFLIQSKTNGDKKYKLIFPEGHKFIQIFTGKEGEVKEAWTTYHYEKESSKDLELSNWVNNLTSKAYYEGKEVYLKDETLNIEVVGNTVKVRDSLIYRNENVSKILNFRVIINRFICINYSSILDPTFPLKNLTVCPNNFTQKRIEIVKEELKSDVRTTRDTGIDTFSLPFLIANDKLKGELIYYVYERNPTEEEMYKKMRENPNSIWEFSTLTGKIEFEVKFPEEVRCIKFPISAYSNLTLNVTMPSLISFFNLGNYPEIITESYLEKNSLIARIRPYPLEGVTGMEEQVGEVCM